MDRVPFIKIEETPDKIHVRDSWRIFSHTINNLDHTGLQVWKDARESLRNDPQQFSAYITRLRLKHNTLESCTNEEKLKVLWRFIAKNTRLHKGSGEIISQLFYAKYKTQNLNDLYKDPAIKQHLSNTANCYVLSFLYKTLAKEFFNLDGHIEGIDRHAFFVLEGGGYADFAEASINSTEYIGYFSTLEEHNAYLRTRIKAPIGGVIKKMKNQIMDIFRTPPKKDCHK